MKSAAMSVRPPGAVGRCPVPVEVMARFAVNIRPMPMPAAHIIEIQDTVRNSVLVVAPSLMAPNLLRHDVMKSTKIVPR